MTKVHSNIAYFRQAKKTSGGGGGKEVDVKSSDRTVIVSTTITTDKDTYDLHVDSLPVVKVELENEIWYKSSETKGIYQGSNFALVGTTLSDIVQEVEEKKVQQIILDMYLNGESFRKRTVDFSIYYDYDSNTHTYTALNGRIGGSFNGAALTHYNSTSEYMTSDMEYSKYSGSIRHNDGYIYCEEAISDISVDSPDQSVSVNSDISQRTKTYHLSVKDYVADHAAKRNIAVNDASDSLQEHKILFNHPEATGYSSLSTSNTKKWIHIGRVYATCQGGSKFRIRISDAEYNNQSQESIDNFIAEYEFLTVINRDTSKLEYIFACKYLATSRSIFKNNQFVVTSNRNLGSSVVSKYGDFYYDLWLYNDGTYNRIFYIDELLRQGEYLKDNAETSNFAYFSSNAKRDSEGKYDSSGSSAINHTYTTLTNSSDFDSVTALKSKFKSYCNVCYEVCPETKQLKLADGSTDATNTNIPTTLGGYILELNDDPNKEDKKLYVVPQQKSIYEEIEELKNRL